MLGKSVDELLPEESIGTSRRTFGNKLFTFGGEGVNRRRFSPTRGMLTGAEPVSNPEEAMPIAIDSHRDGSASYSRLVSLNCSSISSIVLVVLDVAADVAGLEPFSLVHADMNGSTNNK